MKHYAYNIDEFKVGEFLLDRDGYICVVTNKTPQTLEIYIHKRNRKGVSHKSLFNIREINIKFRKYEDKSENENPL